MNTSRDISIQVPVLARVEGEGALELEIKNSQISHLNLRIFEPPRYFEKFLEGRDYNEVIDFVARICGICPVAYQMSASQAMENGFDIQLHPAVRALRRAMYCGEWMESHGLHVLLLAAPDFLGFNNVISMAQQYPEQVRRGLKLQGLGNQLIKMFGGRSVHPVGLCVGGFYKIPDLKEIDAMLQRLKDGVKDAEQLVLWTGGFDFPKDEQIFTSVALCHPNEYPMNEGRLVSSQGLDIAIDEFEMHFREIQVPYSNAFHSQLNDEPYLVGPLARVNLNHDKLPPAVKETLEKTAITFPSQNMFHSIVTRAAEIYFALLEAIDILENIDLNIPPQDLKPRAGVGYGCTEAPRGVLWHRYELDEKGHVVKATIVPPTSQNQARIEQNLKTSLTRFDLSKSDEELRLHAETIIRNYDPCISCSTHFLNLKTRRNNASV